MRKIRKPIDREISCSACNGSMMRCGISKIDIDGYGEAYRLHYSCKSPTCGRSGSVLRTSSMNKLPPAVGAVAWEMIRAADHTLAKEMSKLRDDQESDQASVAHSVRQIREILESEKNKRRGLCLSI